MGKRKWNYHRIGKWFAGIGLLLVVIYAEVAGDLGNAIVAWWGLSGKSEAAIWLFIASTVGVILSQIKQSEKKNGE